MTKSRRFHGTCDYRAVSGWCNAYVNYTLTPCTYECVEDLLPKATFGIVRWAADRWTTSSRAEVVDQGSWEQACMLDIDREGCSQ